MIINCALIFVYFAINPWHNDDGTPQTGDLFTRQMFDEMNNGVVRTKCLSLV